METINKSNTSFAKKLKIVAILGMFAVILGAFGSHGLKPHLSIKAYSAFQTGIQYHFYHTLVAFVLIILSRNTSSKCLDRSFYFFIVGIFLFSGSLYALSIKDLTGLSFLKIAGPITPIGGLFLILGWGMILKAAFTLKK